jgi:ribonuclease BN (tRNA processing enzyme)
VVAEADCALVGETMSPTEAGAVSPMVADAVRQSIRLVVAVMVYELAAEVMCATMCEVMAVTVAVMVSGTNTQMLGSMHGSALGTGQSQRGRSWRASMVCRPGPCEESRPAVLPHRTQAGAGLCALLLTLVKRLVSSGTLNNTANGDRMVILGSGGARIVVAKQLRASGGIWFSLAGTRFLLDPGPGSLVRMTGSRHHLDPTKLSAILLSHRHLDHSGDVNNMIEAMTMGGTEPRGVLFAPSDALAGDDPVVLKYVRPFLERVVTLAEGGSYELGNVRFTCPVRHQHRGEVYGFRFEVGADEDLTTETPRHQEERDEGGAMEAECGMETAKDAKTAKVADEDLTTKTPRHENDSERPSVVGPRSSLTVSYIADTRYFPELAEHYRADVVIMNVVRPTPSQLDHLSAPDAEELVKAMRPKLTVLGHFGMRMLAAKPWVIAREMSERTGCNVVAASDGMLVDLGQLETIPESELPVPDSGAN